MNEADALDIVQNASWAIMVSTAPAIIAAMVIGVVIALIQALTQVQEMTLTFIPKIIVIILVSTMTGAFTGNQISVFANSVYSHIEGGF